MDRKELPEGLLDAARNWLDITWEDTEGDRKLAGILLRGMHYIDDIAGEPLDYTREELHRELLLSYALYARAGCLGEFQGSYLAELLMLQTRKEVERRAAERAADL